VPVWKRLLSCGALVFFAVSGSALAQGWRVGASAGLVNDVKGTFRLGKFGDRDVNGWIDFIADDQVAIRATFGSLKVNGSQAGHSVSLTPGAPPTTLPDFKDRINYGTLGVSYEFFEGNYTSGVFAGIGAYRNDPESVDPALRPYQDPNQTVFGWHVGVDGNFRVFSRVSIVVRLTYHYTTRDPRRQLLNADAGLQYRF
jgi:hypothetical protein